MADDIRQSVLLESGISLVLQIMLRYLLTALIVVSAIAAKADPDFQFPQYGNIYVNDLGNLLDDDTEQRLIGYLKEVRQHDGVEMSLLTIPSLARYNAGPSIEPFSTALFNHWGVGDAQRNNGVLIIVSATDRKMRIELGGGYATSWDSRMKRLIDNVYIPFFKSEDYRSGIEYGLIETIGEITGAYPDDVGNSLWTKSTRKIGLWVERLQGWVWVILAPIFFIVVSTLRKLWRHRPRKCTVCANGMTMLGEEVDDEHLEGGQRLEEYLQSVDYDVWQCGRCRRMDIYRYKSFFTDYSTCTSCNYRTLQADSTIIDRPTTSSSGSKRIDYHCKNCDFRDSEIRLLPRIQESSSSSSSSSGSFGGGGSSGGGASGSW